MAQQFDLMGQSYEAALRNYPDLRREELDYLLAAADITPGAAAIDFTAGTGFVTLPLADRVGPTGRVTAVDSSGVMLDQLRGRLADPAEVTCVHTDDPHLAGLPTAGVDRVVSLGGFHHVEDQVAVCRALHRILRPGGRAVVMDFADASPAQEHFDGLVHDHNPGGHCGLFLSPSRATNLARLVGCRATVEAVRFWWRFPSLIEAGRCFVQLHGLRCPAEVAAARAGATFAAPAAGPIALAIDYVVLVLHRA